ncbi:12046_t:CDS:2 [Funneliformis caledonium]|uniref:12046_t:CDS:1 n=1 Tax=Funneliformis caledonium TaxID=1117310 RepID=A0A9N9BI41_9GLOM|nr:12046_t:CDS:2 [Funneliformis caledonium]
MLQNLEQGMPYFTITNGITVAVEDSRRTSTITTVEKKTSTKNDITESG